MIVILYSILVTLISGIFVDYTLAKEFADPKEGHPRATYFLYSEKEIKDQASAIRESKPQMHRGGWEWDRLLERYIDSNRKDPNELQILKAYILSIIDRYQEAKSNGEGLKFTLFYNHKSWGSGGRMRIYEELVNQEMLTDSEVFEFKELVLHSLEADFPDYSLLERGVIIGHMVSMEVLRLLYKCFLITLPQFVIENGLMLYGVNLMNMVTRLKRIIIHMVRFIYKVLLIWHTE